MRSPDPFQSLIGTVQPDLTKLIESISLIELVFQSLIGTVQHDAKVSYIKRRTFMFQSLIGTVQPQYLLRFLFSLYPIFPVFQPFSPKKSVNLFIVNSRKALILLAFYFCQNWLGGSPTF